ncbi:MAG: hypothetical protein JXA74_04550 [Anaerolineae bacterium]|nr:hypothetical protein [Anaerolineae bacterium]
MFIRGGITAIMAVIAYAILGADPWVLILPIAVVALVCLKWGLWPRDDDDPVNNP